MLTISNVPREIISLPGLVFPAVLLKITHITPQEELGPLLCKMSQWRIKCISEIALALYWFFQLVKEIEGPVVSKGHLLNPQGILFFYFYYFIISGDWVLYDPCFPQTPSITENDLELPITLPNARSMDQQCHTHLV